MWNRRTMLLSPDAPVAGGGGSGSAPGAGTQSGSAGAGSPSGSGGGGFQVPAGQRLVSESDFAARDAAFTTLSGLGFKDAAEFGPYGNVVKAAREGGHDLNTLVNLLGRKAPEKAAGKEGAGEDPQDFDKKIDTALTARERAAAEQRHREYGATKLPGVIESLGKGLLGEKPGDLETKIVPRLIRDAVVEARAKNAYAAGHHLEGMPGELSDKDIEAITTEIKSVLDLVRGAQLKAIGQAANRQPSGAAAASPTGNPGGQGKADAPDPSKAPTRSEIKTRVQAELGRLEGAGAR